MNDQTWIFRKAISPLFADRVTNGAAPYDLCMPLVGSTIVQYIFAKYHRLLVL